MISRDLMTALGFLVARSVSWLRPVEFRARPSGKLVTALQMIAFVALLRRPEAIGPMIWAVGLASLYSIVDYTWALANAAGGPHWRPYLAFLFDLELEQSGGMTPAIQFGLGGGARFGVVLRSSVDRWR